MSRSDNSAHNWCRVRWLLLGTVILGDSHCRHCHPGFLTAMSLIYIGLEIVHLGHIHWIILPKEPHV